MAILKKVFGRASERGAEVIEFALVLPLLLLVVFGLVDFGFLFQKYVVLTNAAMEGARVGVLPGYNSADTSARVVEYAVSSGIPNAGSCPPFCVYPDDVGVAGSTPGSVWPAVQVTVTYINNYQFIGPIASLFGGSLSSVTLTARSTMRKQIGTAPGGGS